MVQMKLALKILGGVALVVALVVGVALWRMSQFGAKSDPKVPLQQLHS